MMISVVMPVYNAERFVRFVLDSVMQQTYSDWECVCVDDGSTDGSGAILDEYAAKDARFRVVHQANGGEGAARNAGMDLAAGDVVAFLDSDDVWHPDTLRLIAATREATGADVIRYGWKPVSAHEGGFEPLPAGACGQIVDLKARNESTIRFCTLGAATAVSMAVCGDIRFSSLTQGADLVFVLDCLLRSGRAAIIEAPLLHYLTHPNQISRRVSRALLEGSCKYLPEIAARCARLGECAAAAADTRRYVSDLMFRRLAGSWRLLADTLEREAVRRAFWTALRRLAELADFFSPCRRRAVLRACRRESVFLLNLFVVLPYRLERKMV